MAKCVTIVTLGEGEMTVGIGIKCSDGIVLACDSLTTFGRGVPVLRYDNKVDVFKHDKLENEVAVISAGMTTYFDKFRDRACRRAIETAFSQNERKLDVVDFSQDVCEPIMTALLKEYAIDRVKFLGVPIVEFSLSLIIAGATYDKELRAYFVHQEGVSEPIDHYGTIGSGAAYAELFLRFLLVEPEITAVRAGELAIYAIKGVELMDPNVGGETNVKIITLKDDKLDIADLPMDNRPEDPKKKMEEVLQDISKGIEKLVAEKKEKQAKGKVQFQQETDEDRLPESIIAKCYSDFNALVAKSYFPRFSGLSKRTGVPESGEEPIAPKSCKEPEASQAS